MEYYNNMKNNDVKFSMRLKKKQMEFLKNIAEKKERSVSFIIRKMIDKKEEDQYGNNRTNKS